MGFIQAHTAPQWLAAHPVRRATVWSLHLPALPHPLSGTGPASCKVLESQGALHPSLPLADALGR